MGGLKKKSKLICSLSTNVWEQDLTSHLVGSNTTERRSRTDSYLLEDTLFDPEMRLSLKKASLDRETSEPAEINDIARKSTSVYTSSDSTWKSTSADITRKSISTSNNEGEDTSFKRFTELKNYIIIC